MKKPTERDIEDGMRELVRVMNTEQVKALYVECVKRLEREGLLEEE
jgi:hypothetical protein